MKKKIIIGTRKSKLALWQAEHVAKVLKDHYPGLTVELKHIVTKGDKILDVSLAKIGGKGLFTKEIEKEILSGEIDLAVHSLKDVPTELPQGLQLAAIMKREDSRDALVSPCYKTLEQLPPGARVGTSSLRRSAQLLHCRPDLQILDLRGNVDTRLQKLDNGDYDAIVLAVAGLKRLGLAQRITQIIPETHCLPAVGQGALAIEAREDDAPLLQLLTCLDDTATHAEITAERAFLRRVEGGCQVPVGVCGKLIDKNTLSLEAVIISPDGKTMYRNQVENTIENADVLGTDLAETLLKAGGKNILASLGLLTKSNRRNHS